MTIDEFKSIIVVLKVRWMVSCEGAVFLRSMPGHDMEREAACHRESSRTWNDYVEAKIHGERLL